MGSQLYNIKQKKHQLTQIGFFLLYGISIQETEDAALVLLADYVIHSLENIAAELMQKKSHCKKSRKCR
jgi:hypothetical protein